MFYFKLARATPWSWLSKGSPSTGTLRYSIRSEMWIRIRVFSSDPVLELKSKALIRYLLTLVLMACLKLLVLMGWGEGLKVPPPLSLFVKPIEKVIRLCTVLIFFIYWWLLYIMGIFNDFLAPNYLSISKIT